MFPVWSDNRTNVKLCQALKAENGATQYHKSTS